MIDHLSASQMNLYLQCGLKYRFQYVDQIPRPFKSSGLALGSAVHSALAWFHRQVMRGREVALDKLYRTFEADWFSLKVDSEIRYREREEEMRVVVTGKEILALYYHWYFRYPDRSPKGVEVPFAIPLTHPSNGETLEVPLEGIIDLVENDGTIVEFKTSSRALDARFLEDNLQLSAYSYAHQRLFGKKTETIKLVDFVKLRTPKIEVFEVRKTKDDHERLFFTAREILKGIRSGVFVPCPSFFCKDCEYATQCREWKGN
jgi:CRISPR/Cas system-associated exonuclease Cas4 (RecB family)